MNLINVNTLVVIEYSKGPHLYPTHEVIASEDYLPLEGLLQACEEFVFGVNNSTLTAKRRLEPVPHIELFVENHEEPSTLTIHYYDLHEYSLTVKAELTEHVPKKWIPSKEAVKSFPHILGDSEMKEDESVLEGYTEVDGDTKKWIAIEKTNLTAFLIHKISELVNNQQLVFKIPTYPLVEVQDLERVSYKQMWLVKEKV